MLHLLVAYNRLFSAVHVSGLIKQRATVRYSKRLKIMTNFGKSYSFQEYSIFILLLTDAEHRSDNAQLSTICQIPVVSIDFEPYYHTAAWSLHKS